MRRSQFRNGVFHTVRLCAQYLDIREVTVRIGFRKEAPYTTGNVGEEVVERKKRKASADDGNHWFRIGGHRG